MIIPVVLVGGQGKRMWPISRSDRPKQFLSLRGPYSLFQETLQRIADAAIYGPALVVTHTDYRFIVAEQAAELGHTLSGIILEPEGRDTAMAIAVAAIHAIDLYGEETILHVMPSDHGITVSADYYLRIERAGEAARAGMLVAFGIGSRDGDDNHGHIETDGEWKEGFLTIRKFHELPREQNIDPVSKSPNVLCNSGMYMVGASQYLSTCELQSQETFAAAQRSMQNATKDSDFIRLDVEPFLRAPGLSAERIILSGKAIAVVVVIEDDWSDLDNWHSYWKSSARDETNNASVGSVTLVDVENSLVLAGHGHVVAEGLRDMAVIASGDAIYVGRLSATRNVDRLVSSIQENGHTALLKEMGKTAYRPWGGYTSVITGNRFQVKRLFVKPGKRLSLQKHHHRAEHWIVVRGTAEVVRDGEVVLLGENQAIYLPQGCIHRLGNPGRILLELIEVQTGSYLGEDDIIRLEDEFGRA